MKFDKDTARGDILLISLVAGIIFVAIILFNVNYYFLHDYFISENIFFSTEYDSLYTACIMFAFLEIIIPIVCFFRWFE